MRPARGERPLFDRLASVGITRRLPGGLHAPCVRLSRFQGRFLATDLLTRNRIDHVFPLMFEQVYLIRNMDVQPGEDVLELCVGCGVNSLFAADVARSVTAVDVSPRALAFAWFNEALGPVAVALDCVPARSSTHSTPAGGTTGSSSIPPSSRCRPPPPVALARGRGRPGRRAGPAGGPTPDLAHGGHFVMITWSPGSADEARVTGLCRTALPCHGIHVQRLATMALAPALEPFAREAGYDEWRERLAAAGLDARSLRVRARRARGRADRQGDAPRGGGGGVPPRRGRLPDVSVGRVAPRRYAAAVDPGEGDAAGSLAVHDLGGVAVAGGQRADLVPVRGGARVEALQGRRGRARSTKPSTLSA